VNRFTRVFASTYFSISGLLPVHKPVFCKVSRVHWLHSLLQEKLITMLITNENKHYLASKQCIINQEITCKRLNEKRNKDLMAYTTFMNDCLVPKSKF
jgi:hypothetical protein